MKATTQNSCHSTMKNPKLLISLKLTKLLATLILPGCTEVLLSFFEIWLTPREERYSLDSFAITTIVLEFYRGNKKSASNLNEE